MTDAAAAFRIVVGEPGRHHDGSWRRAATITSPALGERTLWYGVAAQHADLTTTRADPFLLATLVLAMAEGRPVEIGGAPVDADLLRHLREFQYIWEAWFGYTPVPIHADVTERGAPAPAAVVAFSGGADSAFTAWTHTRDDRAGGDAPLRGGMFMHGADIPLDDEEGFARAAARARVMTDELGIELTTVTTNAWTFPVPIAHYTGTGVAAALHLLDGGYGTGLIPSTGRYRDLVVPMNSSPVSDWLLGGSSFAVMHDGSRCSRFEKLHALSEWPAAMASLRVCLHDERHDRNCGRCHKCYLTMASFRVLGVDAPCFEGTPSAHELHGWAQRWPTTAYFQQEGLVLVDAARARGVDERWVTTLRNRIRVAQLKDGVRAAWPGLATSVAAAHERVDARVAPRRRR